MLQAHFPVLCRVRSVSPHFSSYLSLLKETQADSDGSASNPDPFRLGHEQLSESEPQKVGEESKRRKGKRKK